MPSELGQGRPQDWPREMYALAMKVKRKRRQAIERGTPVVLTHGEASDVTVGLNVGGDALAAHQRVKAGRSARAECPREECEWPGLDLADDDWLEALVRYDPDTGEVHSNGSRLAMAAYLRQYDAALEAVAEGRGWVGDDRFPPALLDGEEVGGDN